MRVLLVSPARTSGLESLRKGHQIIQGLVYVAAAAGCRAQGHGDCDREICPAISGAISLTWWAFPA